MYESLDFWLGLQSFSFSCSCFWRHSAAFYRYGLCLRKQYELTLQYCTVGANGILRRCSQGSLSAEDQSIFFAHSFDEKHSFAKPLALQPVISALLRRLLQELRLLRHQVRQLNPHLVKLCCQCLRVVLVGWRPRAAVNAAYSWSGGHSRSLSLHALRRKRSAGLLRLCISTLPSM